MALDLLPVGLGALLGGPFGAAAGLQYSGSEMSAEAQARAAEAQLAEQRAQREAALGRAQPTTQELSALGSQLDYQTRAIDRQEQLLQSIDPALMEAGKQALALLRGQESSTLGPIRDERARQRQSLANSLIAQQGAGALTSSAGIEALNRFDQQTAQTLGAQQQSTLGGLLQTAASTRPNPYEATQANSNYLGLLGNLQNRQVSAINATSITPYAGAPFVQQALQGQNISGIGQSFNQNAAQIAGIGIGGLARGGA